MLGNGVVLVLALIMIAAALFAPLFLRRRG
jgi:hypothetical protein